MAQQFERRGVGEAQVVGVRREPQLGKDVEIGADAQELEAGIDEVRLPLVLRRAQVGEDAVGCDSATPPPPISGMPWRIQ